MTAGKLFPDPKRRTGRIRRGLDSTIKAMRAGGLLEEADDALLALARVAADELDAACFDRDESRYTVGVLIGRYQTVLESLRQTPGTAHEADDALAALFAGVSDDATD